MRAWDQYLKKLDSELGKATVNRWLRSLKVLHFDAANLHLEASDTFHAQWFSEYASARANEEFKNENNRKIKIHLSIAQKPPAIKKEQDKNTKTPFPIFSLDPIDSDSTFEHLVELSQNKIVYKLLKDVTKHKIKEPPNYNPIYLFGPEGVGKTHLLQALYQRLKKNDVKVQYVKLPTFTQNMVSAIKSGKMPEFRRFYRNCDVLLIDDIHHLANKATTQEEFFHTFNTLHIEGKQIILSSHLSPQEIKDVEPRLISRFEWGIVMPLKGPTSTQLKQILQKKCDEVSFALSSSAKDFLVEKFSKSPKVLSRALSALILRAHLKMPQGKQIEPNQLDSKIITQLLADLIDKEVQSSITADLIVQRIAQYFGVEIEDILGKSQSREYVLPRQISMFFCREELKLPYMKIGRIFSRDHSTVMSSIKQVKKNILQKDTQATNIVQTLKNKIFPSNQL